MRCLRLRLSIWLTQRRIERAIAKVDAYYREVDLAVDPPRPA